MGSEVKLFAQENELNQSPIGARQDAAHSAFEPSQEASHSAGASPQEAAAAQEDSHTPAALQGNFYTDELAMQANDQGTESIAESAGDSLVEDTSAGAQKVPFFTCVYAVAGLLW